MSLKKINEKKVKSNKNKKNNLKGGDSIPLAVDFSKDWEYKNSEQTPYSVDLNVGVNEYVFGRTTPDNRFIVSSGIVKNDSGMQLTGGAVSKDKKKKSKIMKKSKTMKKPKTMKKKIIKVDDNKNKLIKIKKELYDEKKKYINDKKKIINDMKKKLKDIKNKFIQKKKILVNKMMKLNKKIFIEKTK